MTAARQNQKRTAIVDFGSQPEADRKLVQAKDRRRCIASIQRSLQAPLVRAMPHSGGGDTSGDTIHGLREGRVPGWFGETRGLAPLPGALPKRSSRLDGAAAFPDA